MKNDNINDFLKLLDEQAIEFIKDIDQECKIDSKKIHPNRADFPIFRPANKEYFEYAYFEGVLEWRIREYLISNVFCRWFELIGFECLVPKENRCLVHFSYSNESFGKDYPFALILDSGSERIGVRYSSLYYESRDDLRSRLQTYKTKYHIDRIEIIDWDDTDAQHSRKTIRIKDETPIHLRYVSLRQFIELHFSAELYPAYRDKVRKTVEQANKIIGFHTIPQLSLRHLSDFKERVLSDLYNFKFEDTRYQKFNKNGELIYEVISQLSSKACDIIRKRCIEDNLCAALIGTEKFAKCFCTSEYLFRVFEASEQNFFDYSTVASGYFKSVELLLEKVMLTTFKREGHEKLWINGYKKPIDGINCRKNPAKKANSTQVRFIDDNSDHFRTEMGSLIWFLHDNDDGWYLPDGFEDQSRAIVHECLMNYAKGCRNEHLHKDVIDEIETIKVIRNNTILCLLYLLGGCKFCEDSQMDLEELGGVNNSYDRLYKKLKSMPSSVNKFYIKTNEHKIVKAIRPYQQKETRYDDQGNITTEVRFVIVDDYDIGDYGEFIKRINPKKELFLSRDNTPKKMWWYSSKRGKVPIDW